MAEFITRKEARKKGLATYFTGKPCAYGHSLPRYVTNGHCSECNRDRVAQWRRNNGGAYQIERDRRIKYLYGITKEQYDEMLARQGGVCAICKKPCASGYRLSVDHDHKTRQVRGLLCHNCNHGIGKFQDNPKLLKAAAEYLVKAVLVECDSAQCEEIARVVEEAMCAAGEEFVTRVPVKVETEIADEWVK